MVRVENECDKERGKPRRPPNIVNGRDVYVNEYVLPTTPGHLFADTPGAAAGAPGTNEPDEDADRILLCWFCLFGTDAKRRNDRGAPFPPISNDTMDVGGRKIPLVALVKAPRIAMVGQRK